MKYSNLKRVTEQEILSGNILIADFMGHEKGWGQRHYHLFWNEIMPVGKKICYGNLLQQYKNEKEYFQYVGRKYTALIGYNIEDYYSAIVEFIRWYNSLNQNKENVSSIR